MQYFYQLKTKKEEHTLEPRLGGDFDYAVYDLKQNLLKPKTVVKKSEAVEFLWNKQKELKTVFTKVEVKSEPEKDSVEKQIEDKIAEGIAKGFTKTYDQNEEVDTDETHISTRKVLLSGSKMPTMMTKDTEYVLVSRLDLDTEEVRCEIHAKAAKSDVEAAVNQRKIVNKLFASLVCSFPDFIENQLCSAVMQKTGCSYEEAVKNYREQQTLRVKVYQEIVDMLSRSLDVYKQQLTDSYEKK